ncbi:PREDICTED: phospholipase A2 [Nicrophorus vespilloides]|uniref:Phospholipase A2 n=1 Tax=Nicrophorus vespilloides TaxID=110193 RepID=A0ABM1NG51_NICVS|nr:PREDICTED: phospholipase A2 [Nicrophorus vespilloides]
MCQFRILFALTFILFHNADGDGKGSPHPPGAHLNLSHGMTGIEAVDGSAQAVHYLARSNDPFGPSRQIPQKRSSNGGSVATRSKRGVLELYNMVRCSTGCNPLIYKGYGCYCGFLGSGFPVDGIDMCCKQHDWCYNTANCPMYLEYFVPYYWKCWKDKSLCAIDHLEWGGSGSCAQRLCECDRLLSECLSRHPCPKSRALCTSSPWRLLQNTFMIF